MSERNPEGGDLTVSVIFGDQSHRSVSLGREIIGTLRRTGDRWRIERLKIGQWGGEPAAGVYVAPEPDGEHGGTFDTALQAAGSVRRAWSARG